MRSLYISLCALFVLAVAPATGQVRISQIYGAGGNTGALRNSDYVELFNAGATPASIAGFSIQYASSTGSNWSRANISSGNIPAGGYFLLRVTAAGANGAAITEDLNVSGTISMAAGAGKVALIGDQTLITAGTVCPSGATLLDFVPYGTAGAGSCPNQTATISTVLAAFRAAGGCTDTDNSTSDFTTATPAPRNSSSAVNPCAGGGGTVLSINDVTQTETNTGSTSFVFTVSLSAPAPVGGVTFDIATADNTATTAGLDYVAQSLTGQTIPATQTTYTFTVVVNGDTNVEPTESFFVNITNVAGTGVTVGDSQGLGTITTDDVSLISINNIQGSGTASPLSGTVVTTTGIVTALRSNGFFLQTPDAGIDANPATSEGILVFTSSAPPAAAAIGNSVQVTGTVFEFTSTGNPAIFTITELTAPTVVQLSTGNALPTPIILTNANLTPTGGITQLEQFEGMLVSIPTLNVVAPTNGNVNEPNATSTTDGVYYGVIPGNATPFREAGIEIFLPVPVCAAGAGCAIPIFDTNPERIRVDSNAISGQTAIDIATGAVLTNVLGVVDHNGSAYTLYTTIAPTIGGAQITAARVPAAPAGALSVVAMNVERLFDTVNDPNTSDPVLTAGAYTSRLGKISLAIRNNLRAPDVIALEEVENLTTAQDLATRINNDAAAASQPNPGYVAFLVEGNDIGGIDVAFLVRATQVSVVSVTQLEAATTYISPCTNTAEILNDRPPLRLRGTATKGGQFLDFTVFVNHLRSLIGIGATTPCALSTDGNRVRAKRAAQANNLAQLIQDELTANSAARILTVGDFNAFEVNDGYVDTINTLLGTPPPSTQVANATSDPPYANMTNLLSLLQGTQRYSFVFDGNHQTLDHALINPAAVQQLVGGGYARLNADFPEIFRGDFNRPERYSDHDPVFAYLTTASNITAQTVVRRSGIVYNRTALTATSRVTIRNNTATTIACPLNLVITGLPDGVTLTNANAATGAGAIYNLTAPLAAGQSVIVNLNFSLNAIDAINYTAAVFSGTL